MFKSIEDLLKKRKEEKALLILNGYSNEDIYTNGEYKTFVWLSKYIDCLVDVGVNIGNISNLLYKLNKNIEVVGFEPNLYLNKIIKSKEVFVSNQMQLINCALSDEESEMELHINFNFNTMASLSLRDDCMPSYNKNIKKIQTSVKCLDNFEDKFINYKDILLKIDVEGYELNVLKGAIKLLNSERLKFLTFEYSSAWLNTQHTFKEVFHLLDLYNYSLFRITPLGLEKLRFYTHEMDNYSYSNYLAIKDEIILESLKSHKIEQQYGVSLFFEFVD